VLGRTAEPSELRSHEGGYVREALIVWGGWSGHEPDRCAWVVGEMLEDEGFSVLIESSTAAFADPGLPA